MEWELLLSTRQVRRYTIGDYNHPLHGIYAFARLHLICDESWLTLAVAFIHSDPDQSSFHSLQEPEPNTHSQEQCCPRLLPAEHGSGIHRCLYPASYLQTFLHIPVPHMFMAEDVDLVGAKLCQLASTWVFSHSDQMDTFNACKFRFFGSDSGVHDIRNSWLNY